MRRIIRRRYITDVAAALGLALLVAVVVGSFWFGWNWKALIGWQAVVGFIDPKDATDRKEALQVYALIVAGVVAAITAAVGLLNLRLTRRNLEQQRELEAQRAQGTALQGYYEQIGKLITDKDLVNTHRKEIRELARGQTLTVFQEVDGKGKGSLLTFLHGAGLIGAESPAVALIGADLRRADLREADLREADLREANLREANLRGAELEVADLREADLREANLREANFLFAKLEEADLKGADLKGADLREARLLGADLRGAWGVTVQQLARVLSLNWAIMPNGQSYKDWRKLKDGERREENAEND